MATPQQLRSGATHIVVGKVNAVYSRLIPKEDGREETHYLVEIEIKESEKGEGLQPTDFVYARCWELTNHGPNGPTPGAGGHRPIPGTGSLVRVHLVKGKDEARGQKDNGFNTIYPNGIQLLGKE